MPTVCGNRTATETVLPTITVGLRSRRLWVRAPPGARLTPRNFRFAKISLRQRVDPAEQIFFARHAGDLIAQLAVFEEKQGRDGANVVLKRKALIFVHVYLRDLDCAGFFAGNLVQERGNHFAGTAPFRPKIDNDRLVALGHFAVKIGFVEFDSCGVVHHFRKGKSKSG
jgi:hypothetical protein